MPRPSERNPRNRIVAITAAVLLSILTIWLITRSHSSGEPEYPPETEPGVTSSAPEPTMPPTEVQERLFRMLPAGYSRSVCKALAPPSGTVAKIFCGQNSEPGGPSTATYTLFPSVDALHADYDKVVRTSTVVVCPGGVQSPGPWHHGGTPQQIGTVMCGTRQNFPTVAWSNDEQLVIVVVQGGQNGPPLDQLFSWWSSHS